MADWDLDSKFELQSLLVDINIDICGKMASALRHVNRMCQGHLSV